MKVREKLEESSGEVTKVMKVAESKKKKSWKKVAEKR